MRISPHIVGTCLSAILATPVLAQQTLLEDLQSQERSASQPSGFGAAPSQDAGELQLRGPSSTTTITNRPRVRPETPPVPSGSAADLQRKLREMQSKQLQEQIQQLQSEPRERNEFQDCVLQSTGRDLPIFGSNLFRNEIGRASCRER